MLLKSLLTGHPRRALRQWRTARLLRNPSRPIKLHLGCGQKKLDGFVNIDCNHSPATDYVGDVGNLPCPPNSVERIETFHVIEHIPLPAVKPVLSHWLEVLRPGGVLVLECPDLEADIREYTAGNTERLFSIFGRQRFPGDAHHWGYTAQSLTELLRSLGFADVRSVPPTDYHVHNEPCIRVEGRKAGGGAA